MKCKVSSGKNTQFLRMRSANFSKPAIGSRRMHRVAVNVTTVGNGAKNSEWVEACAHLQ
jgi:hypothetical protein